MSSSWSLEVETKAAAVPLFKAAFSDWHYLGPRLFPEIITSITIIYGDGSAGSIMQVNFTPALPFSFVKERLDFIDHEKLEIQITLMEGGYLGIKFESFTSRVIVEPKENGSIVKLWVTYKALPGVVFAEDINKAKESFIKTIKTVEEHLEVFPEAYA